MVPANLYFFQTTFATYHPSSPPLSITTLTHRATRMMATLNQMQICNSILDSKTIHKSQLVNCTLNCTTIRDCAISDSILTNCQIYDCAAICDSTISESVLRNCQLHYCTLQDSKLSDCRILGNEATLRCDVEGCELLPGQPTLMKFPVS